MTSRFVALACLLITLVACGARTVDDAPADGGSFIGDASITTPATTPEQLDQNCADGGTCTTSSCACKPTACPDIATVRTGVACKLSPSTLCPSAAIRGCARDKFPNRASCTCTDGKWSCWSTQSDGDCCEENGPCSTSFTCTVPNAGACGGGLLLTCSNGTTYQRATAQSDCPPDAG